MKFERFLLEDYLATKEGKEHLNFFKNLKNILQNDMEKFDHFVNGKLNMPLSEGYFGDEKYYREKLSASQKLKKTENIEVFCEKLEEILTQYPDKNELAYRDMQFEIPDWSLIWSIASDFAFPYLFIQHFYKLQEIAEIFEIPLPPLPGKTQHLERCLYYPLLSKALYEFREEYHLNKEEFCTFLYGFAPRFLSKFMYNTLPAPNRVFLVGASKEDTENCLLGKIPKETVMLWQGSEEIEPGDIVIVYETAPYSRIGSIWRAMTVGFDDPFHYYPGKVFLTNPIKVPYITFNELQKNPVWREIGLVKAHMQGINGRLCSLKGYEELKKMWKKKGFDSKKLPTPPAYTTFYNANLQNEKDVEEQLLEPFLKKIGFKENEWRRQLPIKMGRGFHYYPDYALHVSGKDGDSKADFIWEAKYRIPTKRQEKIDYLQAKSYAIRLQSYGFGLVSMEGIKIYLKENDFSFEKALHFSWEDQNNSYKISEIKSILKKTPQTGRK